MYLTCINFSCAAKEAALGSHSSTRMSQAQEFGQKGGMVLAVYHALEHQDHQSLQYFASAFVTLS